MPEIIAGVDASVNCASIAGRIRASDRSFVCRYYANSGKKRLTLTEAKSLTVSGLKLVVVWEDGFPTVASYFSRAKGVDDGTSAYHDALSLGQPRGSAIYFAVDFDSSDSEIAGPVTDYFVGIADGFDAMSQSNPAFVVGVYGSGLTCSSILRSNLGKYAWLAMSTAWRGHSFDKWNIRQMPGKPMAGIPLDYDRATTNYGAFTI